MSRPGATSRSTRWRSLLVALTAVLATLVGVGTACAIEPTATYDVTVSAYDHPRQHMQPDTRAPSQGGTSAARPRSTSPVALSAWLPSGVAANTGRVAGPARSADLVLDSFRGLGKGRNAHVRTVGSVDELQDTFNAWSVGAERLAARGPKVPDVYRLPDGGIIQWRTSSATGGPSIDIFPVSGRQRTVHLADGVPW